MNTLLVGTIEEIKAKYAPGNLCSSGKQKREEEDC